MKQLLPMVQIIFLLFTDKKDLWYFPKRVCLIFKVCAPSKTILIY